MKLQKVISIRIQPEYLARIDKQIEGYNKKNRWHGGKETRSSFIKKAVINRLVSLESDQEEGERG